MKIYLVGGAVRDQLLGLPVKEKDYVVVGATVDEMLAKGYRQVGKDFPVFLHPETKEEYALARTERKVGRGYTGFSFDTSTHVTIDEDLMRRDLTINAIAREIFTGEEEDPYNGKGDIQQRVLRHVSPAFVEDPVRILRVARFAARFKELGFTVAPETMELMKSMVKSGEVDALVAERVWKELERALQEKNPEVFFQVLRDCEAANVLFNFPILTSSSEAQLKRAVAASSDSRVRFAVLLASQPESQVIQLCDRYRVPNDYRELALLVSRHLNKYESLVDADQILNLFQAADAFRREDRFKLFLESCEFVTSIPKTHLEIYFNEAKKVEAKEFLQYQGKEIALKMMEQRKKNIEQIIRQSSAKPSAE